MLLERSTGGQINLNPGACCIGRLYNMQAFSFGQINVPGQRSMFPDAAGDRRHHTHSWIDYVFVDEHNRHKRLKGRAIVQNVCPLHG
jgi:hypothetical protein